MSIPPITVKEAIEQWLNKQWELNKVSSKVQYEKDCYKAEMGGRPPPPEYVEPGRPVAAEEKDVRLFGGGNGVLPPIGKMDKELSTLKKCEHLRLSTNSLEKIGPGLSSLPNLRILSLGRNKIRKLENLSELPNLEELWISYNWIEKLSGLEKLRNLKVLYMSNNNVRALTEIDKLSANTNLIDLLLVQNPVWADVAGGSDSQISAGGIQEWRIQLLTRLPGLGKIDGQPVEPEEREEAEKRRAGM